MIDKFVKIGFTKKSHGSRGQIKVVVQKPYLEDFAQCGHVFISLMGKPAPFFIENIEEAGDLLLKVEDINSPEDARKVTSKDLFLREQDLTTPQAHIAPQDMDSELLVGFTMCDIKVGKLGPIIEIQEFPQQEMAIVAYNDHEIMIPLHPDLVTSIDAQEKKITLRLPEGLLDL